MIKLTNKIKAETLLVIGGVCIFLTAGYLLLFTGQSDQQTTDECSQYMSNFDCGQYYFNHDDDPAGPYDLTKAREYYRAAITENPKQHELLWYQAGRVDFIEGQFDDALYKFDRQLEYFGDEVPNVYYMIGLTHAYNAAWYNNQNSWQLAEENFKTYLTMSSKAPWPRVDLAWVYFAQGKFAEMKPILEESMEYYPDNPWLLNMYGLAVLNTTENKSEAAPYFRRALEAVEQLTTTEWGLVYPGNNPADWPIGLAEFRNLVKANLELTE